MSAITVVYALLFYVATIILIGGLAWRVRSYFKTPVPMKIFMAPAPLTPSGAAYRVGREVFLFESLFKSSKAIWIFAVLFHACLAVEFISHLRFVVGDVPFPIIALQPMALFSGLGLIAGLAGLWARRVLIDRNAYISQTSDHLMLGLIIGIALAGMAMRYITHTDIASVKAFMLGLMFFDWQPLPTDFFLLVHLLLVAILMIVLPFSKIVHMAGIFFSPSRNQCDDARERRHLADWNAALDAKREETLQ